MRKYFVVKKIDKTLVVIFFVVLMVTLVNLVKDEKVDAASLVDNIKSNPAYEDYVRDVQNGKGHEWGLIPNKYISAGNYKEGFGSGDVLTNDLPSAYNLVDEGYATRIKNQGADEICWAYAWTTVMESNLLLNDSLKTDFSAKQYDYLLASGTEEYAFLNKYLGINREIGSGGNVTLLSYALSSYYQPVSSMKFFETMKKNDSNLNQFESFDEYQDWSRIKMTLGNAVSEYDMPMNNEMIKANESSYVVAEYTGYTIDSDTASDFDSDASFGLNVLVKNSVMKNGAMFVGTFGPYTSGCYDEATKTIIDRGMNVCDKKRGHALAVIGWDDNHAYTDPATGTIKKGAFILQNSWGKDSLFTDYKITYDTAVEQGLLNPDELTSIQIEHVKQFIADYEAPEYLYLAYNYEKSSSNGSSIYFFSADRIIENDFKEIYDYTKEKNTNSDDEGFGAAYGDEENEIVYTFSTESGDIEMIDSIALESHAFFYDGLDYEIQIDTGEGFKKIGTVSMSGLTFGKRIVDVKDNTRVSGEFKVKYIIKSGGEPVDVPLQFTPYFTTTVYTKEVPVEPDNPDEPGGNEPDNEQPDDTEDKEDIKVPNTGLFIGLIDKVVRTLPIAMLLFGAGYIIQKCYKNRKEIFHKIKFDKK